MSNDLSYTVQQDKDDDFQSELSLLQIAVLVWKYWHVGALVFAVFVISSVTYALLASEVYSTKVYLQEPLRHEVNELNVRVHGGNSYSPGEVFKHFVGNLYSYSIRREFFEREKLFDYYNKDASTEYVFSNYFDDKLKVIEPDDKGNTIFTQVKFDIDSPKKAAEVLNKYIDQVSRATINEIINDVKNVVQLRMQELQEEIVSKRKLIKERREDSIIRLQEALDIAQSLGIKNPVDFSRLVPSGTPVPEVSINTDRFPQYALGSNALAAEIIALKNRKSDDPYISNLRNLQEELAFLEAIKIDSEKVSVVRVDEPAIAPETRVRPQRKFIVLVGGILGVIFGMVAIFVAHVVSQIRKQVIQSR